jgi:hypothetical protein
VQGNSIVPADDGLDPKEVVMNRGEARDGSEAN